MTYWAEIMQDDAHIARARRLGRCAADPRTGEEQSKASSPRSLNLTIGKQKLKAELIPPPLIVARSSQRSRRRWRQLEAAAEDAARAIEELDEEHGGEEGLLAEAKTDKGNLTAKERQGPAEGG